MSTSIADRAISAEDRKLLDLADAGCLIDPMFYGRGDLHPVYDALRKHSPVRWIKPRGKGYWQVTSFAAGSAVFRDPKTYSSGLSGDVVPFDLDPAFIAQGNGMGDLMAWSDAPRHTEMRMVLNRPFSPRSVAALENMVRKVVRERLEYALAQGECDIGREMFQIPLRVVIPLIGLPEEETDKLYRMTLKWVMPAALPERPTNLALARQDGAMALLDYARGMIRERQERSADDLVGVLVNGRDAEGKPFELDRMAWNVCSFFIAGFETTASVLSGAAMALARNPDQMALLRRDRSLIPSAVEECIRFNTPSTNMLRTATKDAELAGRNIQPGDWVAVSVIACNRDPAAFEDPHRFDVTRNPRHMAFGTGIHTCIGMHLARLEIRILLEELLNLVGEMEPTGAPCYADSIQAFGPRGVPVLLKAA